MVTLLFHYYKVVRKVKYLSMCISKYVIIPIFNLISLNFVYSFLSIEFIGIIFLFVNVISL